MRAKVEETWPDLNDWIARTGQPWTPQPGSPLAAMDSAATGKWPSALARTSLAIGSEHLLTASAYLLNFGPTIFSMQSLLRTAMLGGAQVVWMLSPDDPAERANRSAMVARDANWNHHYWVQGLQHPDPEAFDVSRLPEVRQTLAELAGDQRRPEVKPTTLVAVACTYVYSVPPDPTILTECMATWRGLNAVAHALPWELDTRPESTTVEHDGMRTTATTATWANLQAALSFSYAFIKVGWTLLDRQSLATPHTPA